MVIFNSYVKLPEGTLFFNMFIDLSIFVASHPLWLELRPNELTRTTRLDDYVRQTVL